MNARDYKIFRPNHYYHVYNRGNNREAIFLEQQDYFNFFKRLKLCLLGEASVSLPGRVRIKPLPQGSLSIIAYCLMPNHFHFLIRQNSDIGIDRLITKVCTSYVKYFNLKYKRVGNLFQDAFKAKLVDSDSYLAYLTAYIHNNPQKPLDYKHSSFLEYLNSRQGDLCDKAIVLSEFGNNSLNYRKFVLGFNSKDLKRLESYLFEE